MNEASSNPSGDSVTANLISQNSNDHLSRQNSQYREFPEWLSAEDTLSRTVSGRPGVSNQTLLANGIHRPTRQELSSIFHFKFSGFIIPYFDLIGKPIYDTTDVIDREIRYARIRYDEIPKAKGKYDQLKGTHTHLYIPRGLQLLDCDDLVVVEGEMKALSLVEARIAAIGIGGFYGFTKTDKLTKEVLINPEAPDLLSGLNVKRILFLGDSDTATNWQFSDAAVKIATVVTQEVLLPRIPLSSPLDKEKGIDDVRQSRAGSFPEFWKSIKDEATKVSPDADRHKLCLDLYEKALPVISSAADADDTTIFRRTCQIASYLPEKRAAIMDRFEDLCIRAGYQISQVLEGATIARIARDKEKANRAKGEYGKKEEESAKIQIENLYAGKDFTRPAASPIGTFRKAEKAPANELPNFLLPGPFTNVPQSAETIFSVLATTKIFFSINGTLSFLEDHYNRGRPDLKILTARELRSRLATHGNICKLVNTKSGPKLKDGQLISEDDMLTIMASAQARLVPNISGIHNSPVLVDDKGSPKVLSKGYHPEGGGRYILDGHVESPSLSEAVKNLRMLLEEFRFLTPGDRSRAMCAILTPALRFGDVMRGHSPGFLFEADRSQTGKGFLAEIIQSLYGEAANFVSQREGGVGSTDESIAQALVDGKPFIQLDNFTGLMRSTFLESLLTTNFGEKVAARVPYSAAVKIDPSRFIFHMTSNGLQITEDLANRLCVIRILKREGHHYREFPEGSLIEHVKTNQPLYLGSVFTVLREWFAAGKQRNRESNTQGRFQLWWQTVDWIVGNVLGEAPCWDPNLATRMTNTDLTWLRDLCRAVVDRQKNGTALTANDIVDICQGGEIYIQTALGLKPLDALKTGKAMARVFGDNDSVQVDHYLVKRGIKARVRKEKGDMVETKTYVVLLQQVPSNLNDRSPISPTDPTIPQEVKAEISDPSISQRALQETRQTGGVMGSVGTKAMTKREMDVLNASSRRGPIGDLVLELVSELAVYGPTLEELINAADAEGIPSDQADRAITVLTHEGRLLHFQDRFFAMDWEGRPMVRPEEMHLVQEMLEEVFMYSPAIEEWEPYQRFLQGLPQVEYKIQLVPPYTVISDEAEEIDFF
ncbi:hypothetical protein BH09VER1_BH09VER1_26430 [soil metagenome]